MSHQEAPESRQELYILLLSKGIFSCFLSKGRDFHFALNPANCVVGPGQTVPPVPTGGPEEQPGLRRTLCSRIWWSSLHWCLKHWCSGFTGINICPYLTACLFSPTIALSAAPACCHVPSYQNRQFRFHYSSPLPPLTPGHPPVLKFTASKLSLPLQLRALTCPSSHLFSCRAMPLCLPRLLKTCVSGTANEI